MKFILIISLVVVIVATFNLTFGQLPSVIGANDDEKEICENRAREAGKTLKEAVKDRPQSCKVLCKFTDGTEETQNSPDGQLCCDVVGVAPTGVCKSGSCPVGTGR